MIADFFNLSNLPWIQRNSHLLQLVDDLYQRIIELGFTPDICQARLEALRGPCAFNIFVKANTILTNQHLGFLHTEMETILRADVVGQADIHRQFRVNQKRLSSLTPHKQSGTAELQRRKIKTFEKIGVLRALSSEYVFLTLEHLLRDSNLRDCKDLGRGKQSLAVRDERRFSKRASILAIIAVTLEQVLDFGDSLTKPSPIDTATKRQTRELSLVLFSYLWPPSPLSFPSEAPVNQTIGLSSDTPQEVFMHNSFWWELYKETADLLPSHLLHVALEKPPNPDHVPFYPQSNGPDLSVSRLQTHHPSSGSSSTVSQLPFPSLPSAAHLGHQSNTSGTVPSSLGETSSSRRPKGITDKTLSRLTQSYMRMNIGVKRASIIDFEGRQDIKNPFYNAPWGAGGRDAIERTFFTHESTIIFPYSRYLDDEIEGSLGMGDLVRHVNDARFFP